MSCPNLPKCPFFNDRMAGKPGLTGILKKKYCEDDFRSCARFRACETLGSPAVPSDLYPNQTDRLAALGAA